MKCPHDYISWREDGRIVCGDFFNRKLVHGCGKEFTKEEYSKLCKKRLKNTK